MPGGFREREIKRFVDNKIALPSSYLSRKRSTYPFNETLRLVDFSFQDSVSSSLLSVLASHFAFGLDRRVIP